MYRHCIFCSARFGTNEVIETFPIGSTLAFDPVAGRLWTVCGRCRRWNLAPIEERWEAVEGAERLFRAASRRVHAGPVGLASVGAGVDLVRVGPALPGEFAAWRYGPRLVSRFDRFAWRLGGLAAATVACYAATAVPALAPLVAVGAGGVFLAHARSQRRWKERIVYRVGAGPDVAQPITLYPRDAERIEFVQVSPSDDVLLRVAPPSSPSVHGRNRPGDLTTGSPVHEPTHLYGESGTTALLRFLAVVNRFGGTSAEVDGAIRLIERAGSTHQFLQRFIHEGAVVGGTRGPEQGVRLIEVEYVRRLALEIAMNEEQERRALSGELALYRSRWKEAEEIAELADGLLPLPQMGDRG